MQTLGLRLKVAMTTHSRLSHPEIILQCVDAVHDREGRNPVLEMLRVVGLQLLLFYNISADLYLSGWRVIVEADVDKSFR